MERVELNLHTDMSKMLGFIEIKEYMKKALEYKMKSIAITDYENVQAFPETQFLQNYLSEFEYDKIKIIHGIEANIKLENDKIFNAILLAKNKMGLENLYKLVSFSYLKYYDKKPTIPFKIYKEYSKGLIIGSCFNNGELSESIISNLSDEELYKIASQYDYLEICPVNEKKKDIVKRIIDISNIVNKPVVVTGNVYYLEQEDQLYGNILSSKRVNDIKDNKILNHFRTTEEMLNEFEFLGKEKAYEVVVVNTNKIADMCEKIQAKKKKKCYPIIENSEIEIRKLAFEGAYKIFGDKLPKEIEDRLNNELELIIENDNATFYIIAQRLVKKANEDDYIVGIRGSVGSSLVAYCLGITEIDPLKYNIPFEVFERFDGYDKPDIVLNFAYEYQKNVQEYAKKILKGSTTILGGTVEMLAEKSAFEYVKKYFNNKIADIEAEQISKKLVGIKTKTGHHTGGLIVIPKGREIYEFTPIQYAEDECNSNIITTHFDYHYLYHNLLELNILGNHILSILHKLKELTVIEPTSISLDDKKTLDMICSADTRGIPEFETEVARNIILETHPTTIEDLIKVFGLVKGTDTWENNVQDLIRSGTATLNEVITCREDIMNYLISIDIESHLAMRIMEYVRKGKARRKQNELWEEYKSIMKEHGVPVWYIKSCEKISYLFPRSHAISYVMNSFRIAYYKANYPKAFYKAYFKVKASNNIDFNILNNREKILNKINELEKTKNDYYENFEDYWKIDYEIEIYEVALEALDRGVIIENI